MTIEWRDPPNTKQQQRGHDWKGFAAELRAHPGKWAVARREPMRRYGQFGGVTGHLKNRYGLEVKTRTETVDGEVLSVLYARWPDEA
jgi:hypothetical protein